MRILALDTSARLRVVAVTADAPGGVVDARTVDGEAVDTCLPRLCAELVAGGAGAVAVVTGPGSLTGIRAGMAAALGVARALGVPLYGVDALEVVALSAAGRGWAAAGDDVVAVADAGRGGVDVARYRLLGGSSRELAPVAAATRLRLADWTPPEGALTVTARDFPSRPAPVRVLAAADIEAGLGMAAASAAARGPDGAARPLVVAANPPAAARG